MSKMPVDVIVERMNEILHKLSDADIPHNAKKQYLDLYETNRKVLKTIDPTHPMARKTVH